MNYSIFVGYRMMAGAQTLTSAVRMALSYGAGAQVLNEFGRLIYTVKGEK